MVDTFVVLGHLLQSTGSIRACWEHGRASMWRVFWANPGAKNAQRLSVNHKLDLMQRAVLPQVFFRCSRWPPQKQIADEIDIVQRKMTAAITRVAREPGEEVIEYYRRRRRFARKLCNFRGLWSQHWFDSCPMGSPLAQAVEPKYLGSAVFFL